jgi:RNA polymerase sigma-70 factor (ECF subfamily)
MTSGAALDLEAFADAVAPDLLSYFLRRVDQPADAADLLGDTLLVLCRRARAIPADPGEARLWAFGVARRTLAGRRRSEGRRSHLQARLCDQVTVDQASPPPESDARLHTAMAGLGELDREIIRLLHWEGSPRRRSPASCTSRPARSGAATPVLGRS